MYFSILQAFFNSSQSAIKMMPNAKYEPPYDSAKNMILVENVDDRNFLTELFVAIYDELPEPKKMKK